MDVRLFIPTCSLLRWAQKNVRLMLTLFVVTVLLYSTLLTRGSLYKQKSTRAVEELMANDKYATVRMSVPLHHAHLDSVVASDVTVELQENKINEDSDKSNFNMNRRDEFVSTSTVDPDVRFSDAVRQLNAENIPESTSQLRINNNSTSLIEILAHHFYLFSAVLRGVFKQTDTDRVLSEIVLIGWRQLMEPIYRYKCCALLNNGDILTVDKIKPIVRDERPQLPANEFVCFVDHSAAMRVQFVSMTTTVSNCSLNPDTYLKPYNKAPVQNGLAVCSKIGYWSLDAKFLVEWFEIVKLLGVSKVISYTYELNKEAMNVLRYYESTGFADVYAFDYPDKETIPREMNQKNVQCYSDKSVAVYDCAERLSNYRYVTVMDKDELIIPETDRLKGALLTFLEDQMLRQPMLGSLTFETRMHDIAGNSLTGNSMYTDHYHKCSPAMKDRPKNIYLPTRTVPGKITTHTVLLRDGFKSVSVPPDVATIHHFRKPRVSYFNGIKNADLQYNVTCDVMRRLSQAVKEPTQRIRSELGLV